MSSTAIDGLSAAVKGRVVLQGQEDYDEARALFNAMIDKYPAAIAYCNDEADVAAYQEGRGTGPFGDGAVEQPEDVQ